MRKPMVKPKYAEIQKLYEYCIKIGIDAELVGLYDGYCIVFPNGSDFIQHMGSYQNDFCVEPCIGCRCDYKPCLLDEAKRLVKYHKEKLNRRTDDVKT